jgi:signal transduction histidine kinase/ligand-binding sensor domain-containing protein
MPPTTGDATFTNARKSDVTRLLATLTIFLACTAGQITALDPTSHITQYGHSVWRVQDGYFGGKAWTIAQTTDGYIWVGTDAGLYQFDGVRFVRWTGQSGEELPSNRVVRLLGARDGSLWIGTSAGLARLVGKHIVVYQKEQWLIRDIIEDRDGNIWFDRFHPKDRIHPLCQVVGATVQCHGSEDGVEAVGGGPLARDSAGNLWVGGNTNLVRWRPPADSTVYRPKSLESNAGSGGVQALLAADDGSVWVGMVAGKGVGLQHEIDGVLRPFIAPGLNGESLEVTTLCSDHHNNIWVGTSEGIYRIHGSDIDHYGNAEGLSSDYVAHIFEDREGNIWVATSQGLDMFRDLRVKSISKHEGLITDAVQSVAASQDGRVWIGTTHLQILGPQGISFEPAALPGNLVTSIFEDHAGRLWCGMNNTLFVKDGGEFRQINKSDGQPVGMVAGITEDVQHNIWIESFGTKTTLLRIHDFKVEQELSESEIPLARRVLADPQDGIWLGLANGNLARYRNGQQETIVFDHHTDAYISAMTRTPDGSILGGATFGVLAWKNGKKQILTVQNGLPCNSVYALTSDNAGDLWLYAECGLVEIPREQMQLWWSHPDSKLELRVFDTLDGVETGRASFTSSARTPDGRLWFANGSVVQVIDPAHIVKNSLPPPVDVNAVIADQKNYPLESTVRLPPLTRSLEIDYTALSYVAPQKVLFRYKLEGHDLGWQEPGTRRQAFYTDLRPGRYRFRVIACNSDGVWNETGASLDFSVRPAYYQTTWFRVLCAAAFFLVLWAFYQLRVRHLQKQFAIGLDARVNERTRIARDLHDTLLQTLHGLMFQFQAVRNLLPRRPEDAMRSLDEAIDETEKALAESRNAIQGLRSEAMAKGNLAEMLLAASSELANSLGETGELPAFELIEEGGQRTLTPGIKDELGRIALEILRNAFRHAQATRIEAEIRYDHQELRVRIRDNGRGIDNHVLSEGGIAGHWGLQGVRERAERIGARLDFWSEAGAGTEVQLAVPSAVAYESSRRTSKSIRKVRSRA